MNFGNLINRIKNIPLITNMADRNSIIQFVKYLITGLSSALFEYLIFRFLLAYIKENMALAVDSAKYIIPNTVAYVVVFVYNFLLNRFWSFNSKSDLKLQLVQYSMLLGINLVATNAIMFVLSGMLAIAPEIAKLFAMGAIVLWNFVIYKKIIFK